MFGWFRKPPRCPIDPAWRNWVDYRWQWLAGAFGVDRVRRARVILPRAEFFPDLYRGTEEDARRLLDRVCGYMDVDPATVEMSLHDERSPVDENPFLAGGWRHGAAGLYSSESGKLRISIESGSLKEPTDLVGTMAHELGHVLLLGHGRISGEEEDHEPLTDLLTVFFGLGVFTANSAVQEQSWQDPASASSGWRVGRQGYLSMPVYGYAFARFARARGEDGSAWSQELRLDVRAPFKQAMRFLSAESAGVTGGPD